MKKIYLLLAFCVLTAVVSKAQNFINFQAKVTQPGITTGNTLEFDIPELNWKQSFSGNVTITNGLFSVTLNLPVSVFDSAHSSRQMIVHLNNALLDTFTILAPVERDPTVRSYIRDSVQWANIRNKPTIDTSNTNELQVLSVSRDTLRLSNGNYVILPRVSDTLRNLTVNGKFTVLDTSVSVITTVPFVGTPNTGTGPYWQSFKATANGKLRFLKINVGAAIASGGITVTIFSGIGNNPPALGTKSFPSVAAMGNYPLDMTGVSGGSSSFISLSTGQLYTFEVKPTIPGATNTVTVLADPTNPYADGISNILLTTDIPFEISIDKSSPPCFTFDANCQVGIGTNTPTAQLDVKGRIKDQTGFVMPVGTIIAYGGRNVPAGWLLCDGTSISRATYADLFEAIDTSWGSGSSAGMFNVPDLRGRFVRGLDYSPTRGATGNDPEYTLRTAINIGGNTGNNVGSLQNEQLKSHTHATWGPFVNISTSTGAGQFSVYQTANYQTGASGGLETRPKNAAVNYIIKY